MGLPGSDPSTSSQPSGPAASTGPSLPAPLPADMKPLPATGPFTIVPGQHYRVSVKLKDWSASAAAAARAAAKTATATLWNFAAMWLEYQTPPANHGPVLIFAGGVKLTEPNQTVSWDFTAPSTVAAGTPVLLRFGYSSDTQGVSIASTTAVLKIPGTVGAAS